LGLAVIAVINYLGVYLFPMLALEILLLLGGLWLIWAGIRKGFTAKHRAIFKKYI